MRSNPSCGAAFEKAAPEELERARACRAEQPESHFGKSCRSRVEPFTYVTAMPMNHPNAAPKLGDLYRCSRCGLEVQIVKESQQQGCRVDFKCCGDTMKKITPLVQNA